MNASQMIDKVVQMSVLTEDAKARLMWKSLSTKLQKKVSPVKLEDFLYVLDDTDDISFAAKEAKISRLDATTILQDLQAGGWL